MIKERNARALVGVVGGAVAALATVLFVHELTTWIDANAAALDNAFLLFYTVFAPQQPYTWAAAVAIGVLTALAILLVLPGWGRSSLAAVLARLFALMIVIAVGLVTGLMAGWFAMNPDGQADVARMRWWLTDTTPPRVTVSVPPLIIEGPATIRVQAYDEGEYRLSRLTVDGLALPQVELVNLDTSRLADGTHTIVAEVEDTSRQRNRTEATATFRTLTRWWLTDSTPPTITIAVPSGVVRGTAAITLTTSDEGEHRLTSITLDGVPQPFTTYLAVDTALLPDGEHVVVVEAEDASRQRNRSRATATFRSDNRPPVISVRFDPSPATQGHAQFVYVSANEPVTAISVTLAGQPLTLARTDNSYWAVLGFAADAQPRRAELVAMATDVIGNRGQITATWEVTRFNFPVQNIVGEEVIIPPDRSYLLDPTISVSEITYLDKVFAPVSPEPLWTGAFTVPVTGRQTTPFAMRRSYNGGPLGSFHGGADIAADSGVPVLASNRGRVVLAEGLQVRGNAVILDHGMGVYSCYYHLSEINVRVGQMVEKGQVVGLIGSTGLSTGPHLHWEVRVSGQAVDPWSWTRKAYP